MPRVRHFCVNPLRKGGEQERTHPVGARTEGALILLFSVSRSRTAALAAAGRRRRRPSPAPPAPPCSLDVDFVPAALQRVGGLRPLLLRALVPVEVDTRGERRNHPCYGRTATARRGWTGRAAIGTEVRNWDLGQRIGLPFFPVHSHLRHPGPCPPFSHNSQHQQAWSQGAHHKVRVWLSNQVLWNTCSLEFAHISCVAQL